MNRLRNIFAGILIAVLLVFCIGAEVKERYLYLKVEKENIRSTPKGGKIAEVLQSTEMKVLEDRDNWAKVQITGWIWKPSTTSNKAEIDKLQAEERTKPAVTWHEIARWEGKGIKNTEAFRIPSRTWRISWATKPGEYGAMNFQIYVYGSDGSLVGIAANVIGEDADSSVMRGSGEYYLTINTAQPYVVVVEAKY